ncbi:MAG: N-methyl-D-aspartate receptor NMDAR2C subunit [Rubrivivax sp.]|nr:N-methyl-D-aspartate receptor NMDAR2C subunit [Rubrivivax sp.]
MIRARHATDFHAASWQRAWAGAGAGGSGDDVRAALVARYAEPHRAYHTLQHLDECLTAFEAVQHLAEHAAEVEMALWFHDAVYDVHRHDNEEASAEWARAALRAAGAPAAAAARVAALVLATKHQAPPRGADETVLVDIDLAILGAEAPRFAQYEQQIRAEYAFVPEAQFRQRRRDILGSFLSRPRIYGTGHFHALLEERARRNLRRAAGAPEGAPAPAPDAGRSVR